MRKHPHQPTAQPRSHLDDVSFLVGRVYYNYVTILSSMLADTGLGEFLAPGMGPVLFVLFEEDGLQMKDVGRRAGISPSTLSGMMRRMVTAGLLRREADESDGRGARLYLTDLARSLEPRCRQLAERMEAVLSEGFTEEERGLLTHQLQRVIKNLHSAQGKAGGSGTLGGKKR